MKPSFTLLLPLLLFALLGADLYGQGDTSLPALFSQPVVMYVGHFNPDCVPDTLVGFYRPDLRVRPELICWGRLFDADGTPLCDSNRYDHRIKADRHRDTTWIEHPEWEKYRNMVSVLRFNTNDTLADLIFWTRGNAYAIQSEDGPELLDSIPETLPDSAFTVDTSRSLVIFGQVELSSRERIKLGNIRGAQSNPFAAMQLGYAVDLVDPKRREHSGKSSWRLRKLHQVVDSTSDADTTAAPPPGELLTVPDRGVTARVYPNPAIYSTSVQVQPLPAGTYTVELVAADGEVIATYRLDLDVAGHVLETIDLTALSSGHYFIRVRTETQSYGDYPIIVVR